MYIFEDIILCTQFNLAAVFLPELSEIEESLFHYFRMSRGCSSTLLSTSVMP